MKRMGLALIAMVGPVLADQWIYRGIHWTALAAGWCLAGANASGALWLWRRAIGRTARGFVWFGVLANVLRAMVLFGIVVGVWFWEIVFFHTFVLALVTGYFLSLLLACSHLLSVRASSRTDRAWGGR